MRMGLLNEEAKNIKPLNDTKYVPTLCRNNRITS